MRASLIIVLLTCACGRTPLVHDALDAGTVAPMAITPPLDAGCAALAVDAYTIPPTARRPIDVLFVIDDSCSTPRARRSARADVERVQPVKQR